MWWNIKIMQLDKKWQMIFCNQTNLATNCVCIIYHDYSIFRTHTRMCSVCMTNIFYKRINCFLNIQRICFEEYVRVIVHTLFRMSSIFSFSIKFKINVSEVNLSAQLLFINYITNVKNYGCYDIVFFFEIIKYRSNKFEWMNGVDGFLLVQ